MEVSEYIAAVERLHAEARARGLFFQIAEDGAFDGLDVTLRGVRYRAFTSCSYLSLERHPAVVAGVHDAVDRYGAQFASSRGYVSCPLYRQLEERLSAIFEAWALPVPTTTLGHQIALGVLATEKDAIVLDHQSHHSVQMAATLARANGAHVELVKHSELPQAEERVARLARRHRTVWVACDGVYSMYGDLAPVGVLERLLAVASNVRLYVDDAHGMSWAGRHGRGSFLSRMPWSERVVVCTSLVKGFGAGGAALVFADERERERVRMCGGPMVFSGPLQPPMIGASNASAAIHLSDEIVVRQRRLAERVARCNRRLRERALPLLVENEAPIFFVRLGLPRVAFDVAERMLRLGMYVNVSMYPTVPMKRAGIRLALTSEHTLEDVDAVVDGLAASVGEALAAEGLSRDELDALFEGALPVDAPRAEARWRTTVPAASMVAPRVEAAALQVERFGSIREVDRALWDARMGEAGMSSWDALAAAEEVFRDPARPEHHWAFDYVVVRDEGGAVLAATYFTTTLLKDDMLSRATVSKAVEARRRDDPSFLTSRATMMGSLLSEGCHLWLDRAGPWRAAVRKVVEVAEAIHDARGASVILLRDLPGDDADTDALMQSEGLLRVPMLDRHLVTPTWRDGEGLVARAKRRARPELRRVVEAAAEYDVRRWGHHGDPGREALDGLDTAHLHWLYLEVASRRMTLNIHPFPERFVEALARSPAWEVVTLHLREGGPADGRPVAWFAAYAHGALYAPFVCGLDYDYVLTRGAYRQTLYQALLRGIARGASRVDLGMDADLEKRRFGSEPLPTCVYARSSDHYNAELLREIAAEVGVGVGRAAS